MSRHYGSEPDFFARVDLQSASLDAKLASVLKFK